MVVRNVGVEQLTTPSKVALFKLCIGNLMFVVLGLVAVAIGAHYIRESKVFEYIIPFIDEEAELKDIEVLFDRGTKDAIRALCMILIATGIGVIIISLVGFCGSISRSPHLMLGYVLFLIVLVLAEAAGVTLFATYRYKVQEAAQTYLQSSLLRNNYRFAQGDADGITVIFNIIQMKYKCCGLEGYKDYETQFTNWKSEYNGTKLRAPPFCCKFKEDYELPWSKLLELETEKHLTLKKLRTYFDRRLLMPDCLGSRLTFANSWRDKGCFEVFQREILGGLFGVLIGLTATILFIEVMSLLASCILLVDIRSVIKMSRKREEKEAQMKAERDSILQGIQKSGSLAAFAMSGGLSPGGVGSSYVRASMNQMARASMMAAGRVPSLNYM